MVTINMAKATSDLQFASRQIQVIGRMNSPAA